MYYGHMSGFGYVLGGYFMITVWVVFVLLIVWLLSQIQKTENKKDN